MGGLNGDAARRLRVMRRVSSFSGVTTGSRGVSSVRTLRLGSSEDLTGCRTDVGGVSGTLAAAGTMIGSATQSSSIISSLRSSVPYTAQEKN